ncbi:MAG: lysophospholipid acyltransferase family protein [Actinomycetota bacterium]
MRRLEPWYRGVTSIFQFPSWAWFKWRFEGAEHIPREGPVLVAANHISYYDPIAHGYFLITRAKRYPRFLAKIELFDNKLIGPLLRRMKHIPVRRGSGDHGPIEFGLRSLRQGEMILVYPESTVTTNPDFSPMKGKTGIARLAIISGVPVIPLAVWGSAPVWQKGGRKNRNFKYGRPIWVKAGPPLDFSRFEGRADDPTAIREVTDEVMAQLSLLVDDMKARYPKKWS